MEEGRRVRRYVLNAKGEPVPEPNFTRWIKWCRKCQEAMIVAEDYIEGTASVYQVTTLFACFDSAEEGKPPALFRTHIQSLRGREAPWASAPGYSTLQEAIIAHHDVIADLKRMQTELGR